MDSYMDEKRNANLIYFLNDDEEINLEIGTMNPDIIDIELINAGIDVEKFIKNIDGLLNVHCENQW
jgi:hypothetical protein